LIYSSRRATISIPREKLVAASGFFDMRLRSVAPLVVPLSMLIKTFDGGNP
jgi:hypothetical protein